MLKRLVLIYLSFLFIIDCVSGHNYSLIICEFCNSTFTTYDGWTTSANLSGSVISNCGTYHLFGGYGIFSNHLIISKTFSNMVPHFHLNITIYVMMMDYYQTAMVFLIDNTPKSFTNSTISVTQNFCGSNSWAEDFEYYASDFNHSNSTMTFALENNNIGLQYFGFYSLKIYAEICDSTCLTCTGPTSNQCSSCYPNSTLISSSGLSYCSCNNHFYSVVYNNPCTAYPCSICQSCDPNCNGCTGPLNSDCIACATLQYGTNCVSSCPSNTWISSSNLGLCVDSCNSNEYGNITTRVCSSCDIACHTCSGGLSTNCLTCPINIFLYANQCFYICPNGVWGDSSSFTCITSCGSNYYGDSADKICKICDASCLTCSGNGPNNCTGCTESMKLYNGTCVSQCPQYYFQDILNNTCVTDCGVGNYGETSTAQCKTCDASCKSCNGSTNSNCLTCNVPFVLQTGLCLSIQCNNGSYYEISNGTCLSCDSSCSSCIGYGHSNCTACVSSLYLVNATCVNQCPISFWGAISNFTCLLDCGNGNYGDPADRKCKTCSPSCYSCDGGTSSNCLSCQNSLYLQSGQCVAQCSSNYFFDSLSGSCMLCDSSCLTCNGATNTNCLSCSSSFILTNGTCLFSCGFPYWTSGTSCIPNCGSGYYGDQVDRKCKPCDLNCLTCNGGTSFNCSSCISPLLLDNGQCIINCGSGYFLSNLNLCLSCNSTCLECNGPSDSNCVSCNDSRKYLSNNTCVVGCTNPLFERDDTKTCEICNANNCLECMQKWNLCKTCVAHYFVNSLNICQMNLIVKCNFTKIGKSNDFNLTCDQTLNLRDEGINSFISLDFEIIIVDKLVFTYKIEILNNHSFSLNFSSSSNVTNETEFILVLNQTFLSMKYFNYEFNQTNFTNFISPIVVCPISYMFLEATNSCVSKPIFHPSLALTFNPLEINLKLACISAFCNLNEEFNQEIFLQLKAHQQSSFNPGIPDFKSYDWKLLESENPETLIIGISFIILNNVIGTHQFIINFEEKEMDNFFLDQTEVSQKMLNYYILDDSTQSTINSSVSLSTGGSVASMGSMYVNSFLNSDSSFAFRSLMIIEFIYILRFIDLNYPPNAIEMFKNKIEPSKFFLKKDILVDPHEQKLIEGGTLELYEVSPYFLNNFGEILINLSIIFVTCHVFNFLFNYFQSKNIGKTFMKLLKPIHETLVWSILIVYVSSNYLNLCFLSLVNLVYRPLESFLGILNFSFGILSFAFAFLLIVYLFCIIRIIKKKNPEKIFKPLNKIYNDSISFSKLEAVNFKKNSKIGLSPERKEKVEFSSQNSETDPTENGDSQPKRKISKFSNKNQIVNTTLDFSPAESSKKIFQEYPSESKFKFELTKTHEKKSENVEELIERYDIIYNDFKQDTKLSHYLVIFDLFRYFLIAIAVAVAVQHYILVICFILVVNSSFLIFLLVCFPFKEKSKNILTILTEISNVLSTVGALLIGIWDWTENYDPYLRMNAGWVIVYANLLLILQILLLFLMTIIQFIWRMIEKIKKGKQNKVWNIEPKNEDGKELPEINIFKQKEFKEIKVQNDVRPTTVITDV